MGFLFFVSALEAAKSEDPLTPSRIAENKNFQVPFSCPFYRPTIETESINFTLDSLENVFKNSMSDNTCNNANLMTELLIPLKKNLNLIAELQDKINDLENKKYSPGVIWTEIDENELKKVKKIFVEKVIGFKTNIYQHHCSVMAGNAFELFKNQLVWWVSTFENGLYNFYQGYQKIVKTNKAPITIPGMPPMGAGAASPIAIPGMPAGMVATRKSFVEQNSHNLRLIFDQFLNKKFTPSVPSESKRFLEGACTLYDNYVEFLNLVENLNETLNPTLENSNRKKLVALKIEIKTLKTMKEQILNKSSQQKERFYKADETWNKFKEYETALQKFNAEYSRLASPQQAALNITQCQTIISYLYTGSTTSPVLFHNSQISTQGSQINVQNSYLNLIVKNGQPLIDEFEKKSAGSTFTLQQKINQTLLFLERYLKHLTDPNRSNNLCIPNVNPLEPLLQKFPNYNAPYLLVYLEEILEKLISMALTQRRLEEFFYFDKNNVSNCVPHPTTHKPQCYVEILGDLLRLESELNVIEKTISLNSTEDWFNFIYNYLNQLKTYRDYFTENSEYFIRWSLFEKSPHIPDDPTFTNMVKNLKKLFNWGSLFEKISISSFNPFIEASDSYQTLLFAFEDQLACGSINLESDPGLRYSCEKNSQTYLTNTNKVMLEVLNMAENNFEDHWLEQTACGSNLDNNQKRDCRCKRYNGIIEKITYASQLVKTAADFCDTWGQLYLKADGMNIKISEEILKKDFAIWDIEIGISGRVIGEKAGLDSRRNLYDWCINKNPNAKSIKFLLARLFNERSLEPQSFLLHLLNEKRRFYECIK